MDKFLTEILKNSPSLSKKITYEEFIGKTSKRGFDDSEIEKTYEEYIKVLETTQN